MTRWNRVPQSLLLPWGLYRKIQPQGRRKGVKEVVSNRRGRRRREGTGRRSMMLLKTLARLNLRRHRSRDPQKGAPHHPAWRKRTGRVRSEGEEGVEAGSGQGGIEAGRSSQRNGVPPTSMKKTLFTPFHPIQVSWPPPNSPREIKKAHPNAGPLQLPHLSSSKPKVAKQR